MSRPGVSTPTAEGPVRSDTFGTLIARAGHLVAEHPQPLVARACVQLLMRVPGREIEVRDRSGNLQRIDTRDQMGANLLVGRYRLPAPVVARVAPGAWVVDVGANIGVIASQLCTRVGPSGRVWAFEPVPANVDRLGFLKERNALTQLEVFPMALGAEAGSAPIGMPPSGRSGWGSHTKSWGVADRFEVPVERLDALVAGAARGDDRVSFVKIDVEGFEPEVLEGAVTTLRDHRPLVFCEFNDVLLRDRGRSSSDLLDLFADLGYRPVDPDEGTPALLADRVVNLLLAPAPVGIPAAPPPTGPAGTSHPSSSSSREAARAALAGRLPSRYADGHRGMFDHHALPLLRPGATILDVGAGRAPTYPPGARPPGCTYVGLDLLRSELDAAPPGSYDETAAADVTTYVPALADRFDAVVSWQVLEHVKPLAGAMDNLRAYLRPGGQLVAQFSGTFGLFGLLSRLVPAKVTPALLEKMFGRPRSTTFPAYYDHCWSSALEEMGRSWTSFEVIPRHEGAGYFGFSRHVQAAYLAYEEWAVRAGRGNLASYYLVVATR
jgi:FkbM family methyltransferase